MSKTVVVIPAYNEDRNVGVLIEAIRRSFSRADILVVDDNSSDKTADVVNGIQCRLPGVVLIRRHGQRGLGRALAEGFVYCLGKPYEYIFVMDADQSHDPDSLETLYDAARTSANLVIGSRYVVDGKTRAWSSSRRLLSVAANIYLRRVLGLSCRDMTSGFRCYRREALRSVPLNRIQAGGFSFQVESLWHIHKHGHPVVEVPICFTGRRVGRSKLSFRDIAEGVRLPWRLLRGDDTPAG